MDAVNSNQQHMTSETKEQYISPKCEEYEIPTEGVMTQTSYHYQPGWDD